MSRHGIVLTSILAIDTLTTVLGIHYGLVEEGNPFMNWFLEHGGVKLFLLSKLALSFPAIFILEWVGRNHLLSRQKLQQYYRGTIVSYVALYISAFYYLNT